MTASINSLVRSAVRHGIGYGKDVAGLRVALKGKSPEQVRAAILPGIAAEYGLTIVKGQRGDRFSEGKETNAGNNASQAAKNLVKAICGTGKGKSDELDIPDDVLAAARKLVKLCAEYKQAGKLASQALALARAE
jgi:hypothetical protein